MKLFDFMKRKPVPMPVLTPPIGRIDPKPAAAPARKTPEEVLDEAWGFIPDSTGADGSERIFEHHTIMSMAAIASARALRDIANDVEAMRKHVTRLQLVQPREQPQVDDAVDPAGERVTE